MGLSSEPLEGSSVLFPGVGAGPGLVAVLPKAGLQRAADLLLEAGMQDSWILQESAFPSHLSHAGTVQNSADCARCAPFFGHLLPAHPNPTCRQSPTHPCPFHFLPAHSLSAYTLPPSTSFSPLSAAHPLPASHPPACPRPACPPPGSCYSSSLSSSVPRGGVPGF